MTPSTNAQHAKMQHLEELPPEFACFPSETALLNEWRAVEEKE